MNTSQYKTYRKPIRDMQLQGRTREEAVRMWNDAEEVAEVVGDVDELSDGEIREAIALHRRVRDTMGRKDDAD